MSRRLFVLPLFFAAGLFIAGCASTTGPLSIEPLTVEEIAHRLSDVSHANEHFFADGSITVTTPTMNQSVGFELSALGTDSLKMSIYGPFGITVGSALVTRKEFSAYNAFNNTVYRGSPEKQLRSFPIISDIPFELFAGSLRGIHTPPDFSLVDSIADHPGRISSFTKINSNGSYDSYRFDGTVNRITRCTRRSMSGNILWIVDYRYTTGNNGVISPESVEVSIPSKKASLLIEYADITYGGQAGDFRLSFPQDAAVTTIE